VSWLISEAYHPTLINADADFIRESMQCSIKDNHLIDPESKQWGVIKESKLDGFISWMFKHEILKQVMAPQLIRRTLRCIACSPTNISQIHIYIYRTMNHMFRVGD
jgi:hypothetical protein